MKIDTMQIDFLLVYLKLVETMNKKLFLMFAIRTLENEAFTKYSYVTDEFCDAFFRITGYEINKTTQKIETTRKNGVLSLNEIMKIYDIYECLNKILLDNYSLIESFKLYRNKAQHVPHTIQFISLGGTNTDFDISFEFEKCDYKIYSSDVKRLVIELNIVISNLVDELWKHIDLHTRMNIYSKSKIETLLNKAKYLKYNELLEDEEKIYIIDLIQDT